MWPGILSVATIELASELESDFRDTGMGHLLISMLEKLN